MSSRDSVHTHAHSLRDVFSRVQAAVDALHELLDEAERMRSEEKKLVSEIIQSEWFQGLLRRVRSYRHVKYVSDSSGKVYEVVVNTEGGFRVVDAGGRLALEQLVEDCVVNEYGREITTGYHWEPVEDMGALADFLADVAKLAELEMEVLEARAKQLLEAIEEIRRR